MPLLQATRQIHGDYGTIAAGEIFDPGDEQVAESLESRGLACRWRPHRPSAQKVLQPSEFKAESGIPQPEFSPGQIEPELIPVRRRK